MPNRSTGIGIVNYVDWNDIFESLKGSGGLMWDLSVLFAAGKRRSKLKKHCPIGFGFADRNRKTVEPAEPGAGALDGPPARSIVWMDLPLRDLFMAGL